jgi:hypothetical protein
MPNSDATRAAPRAESPFLGKVAELKEHQGWAHHVADAATGKLLTTQLSRPIAPLSRAERLSQLGEQVTPAIFVPATYRLTPQFPYQASPQGYLRFYWAREVSSLGDLALEGHAFWSVAEDIPSGMKGGAEVWIWPGQGRWLLTVDVDTENLPGQVGTLRIEVGKHDTVIASFQLAAHNDYQSNILDLIFATDPDPTTLWIWMFLERGSGLKSAWFNSLTLRPWLIVVSPTRPPSEG